MSTEENFETDISPSNTVLLNDPQTEQSEQSSEPEGNIHKSESAPEEAVAESETVDIDKVDEELLKVDKKKQARIGYTQREAKRRKEQELRDELSAIKDELRALRDTNKAPAAQTAQSTQPNLVWDEHTQTYIDPNDLINYANNLLAKNGNAPLAQTPSPQQPPASPAPPAQPTQPTQPQQPRQAAQHKFSAAVNAQANKLTAAQRSEYNIPPNQLSPFEANVVDLIDQKLLTPAMIEGAALASDQGLETLYEWSQSDAGKLKLQEISAYYNDNPYQQAAEIGRLVKVRDEQRAARSKSNVPQQAQPLTETAGDMDDYWNRSMTEIINDYAKRY